MRAAGSHQYPAMDSVIYGKPAAEALREEAERLDARRVFLIASRTLNTRTDEIEKIRASLGVDMPARSMGYPNTPPARSWCRPPLMRERPARI